MKHSALFIICFLFSLQSFSQESFFFVSSEIDVKNALFGSSVNEPAYDGVFNLGYRNNSFQVQASYENFKAIDFYSFGFKGGYVFNHEKDLNFALLGGLSWIQRNVDWLQKVLFISGSLSGQVEYHLSHFFISLRGEGRYRGDLQEVVPSGYAGIGIKF